MNRETKVLKKHEGELGTGAGIYNQVTQICELHGSENCSPQLYLKAT